MKVEEKLRIINVKIVWNKLLNFFINALKNNFFIEIIIKI